MQSFGIKGGCARTLLYRRAGLPPQRVTAAYTCPGKLLRAQNGCWPHPALQAPELHLYLVRLKPMIGLFLAQETLLLKQTKITHPQRPSARPCRVQGGHTGWRRGRWAAWLQWQGRAVAEVCQTRPVPVLLCSRPARAMNSHAAAGRGQLGAARLPQSSAAQRLVLGAVPRRARRACRPERARTTQAVAAPPQQRSSGNGVAVAEPGTDLEVDSVLAKELGENGVALRPSWLDSG